MKTMAKTSIEWTEHNWNPFRGCSKVSPGCQNCYAETIAKRFSGDGLPYAGVISDRGHWNGKVELIEEKLLEPLKRKTPTTYFVNSMSDTFHEAVPDEWIDKLFAVMAASPNHTFQLLTKRPQRMFKYFQDIEVNPLAHAGWTHRPRISRINFELSRFYELTKLSSFYAACCVRIPLPFSNVYLGVSVEDQLQADVRIPFLLETPAALRFVSAEPLLGQVSLEQFLYREDLAHQYEKVDWVIVGGESGPKARPFHLEHAFRIIEDCKRAGTAVFFKQAGSKPVMSFDDQPVPLKLKSRKGNDLSELPEILRVRELPK
jgi:protein gp37